MQIAIGALAACAAAGALTLGAILVAPGDRIEDRADPFRSPPAVGGSVGAETPPAEAAKRRGRRKRAIWTTCPGLSLTRASATGWWTASRATTRPAGGLYSPCPKRAFALYRPSYIAWTLKSSCPARVQFDHACAARTIPAESEPRTVGRGSGGNAEGLAKQ